MKKVVLKLEFDNEKIKQKAMTKVSGLPGVESIAMNSKDKKLTVIGGIDPVCVVNKLRKLCETDIVLVGSAKEPEEEKPKPEVKTMVAEDKSKDYMSEYLKAYAEYYKQQQHYYCHNYATPKQHLLALPVEPTYYARNVEENPNSCVIC